MPLHTIGDLAASLSQIHQASRLKGKIGRLTNELATGQTQTPHARTGGNHALLSDLAARKARLNGYAVVAAETAATASAMQTNLGFLAEKGQALSNTLLTGDIGTTYAAQSEGARLARSTLADMVNALNGTMGGAQLFSGDKVQTPPLAPSDDILAGLQTALAGLTDASDINLAAETWFGPGGGFETLIYQGGTADRAAVRLDDQTQIDLGLRADHPVLRAVLKETALLALSDNPALALNGTTINTIRQNVSAGLTGLQDNLTNLQAELGTAQSRIEDSASRTAASQISLETVRASLLEADPFATAARLEDAQFRLDALYTVTARSASLKLVNYL